MPPNYESYDFSDPPLARRYLLELEQAETNLDGLGRGIATVGCALAAASMGILAADKVISFKEVEQFGQGVGWVAIAGVALGGVCTVLEQVRAYMVKRKMHAFFAAWISSSDSRQR
ncbi:MAG TPA: hypothetical protein VJ836_03330 [Candidatus Saccharimonadales bacterium]|nr:hypothetical protein [Candidatus Saccharimonadales bacterium]